MLYAILGKKQKNFQGDEGEDIGYYWYTATDKKTGYVVKFGSPIGDHEIGKEYDLNISQDINSKGKPILKEISV